MLYQYLFGSYELAGKFVDGKEDLDMRFGVFVSNCSVR
jgi:hypothetical protein